MSNMKQPFERKTLNFLALVLVSMLLGACSSSNSRGCVTDLCVNPLPEGWRLAYMEVDDDNNGIVNSITRFMYSSEGEYIASTQEDMDSSSKEKYEYRHDFDKQGRLKRVKADPEHDGGFESSITYHYDRHGNLSKVKDILLTHNLSYDDSCRVKEISSRMDEYRFVISYDETGRRVKEQVSALREIRDADNKPSADSKRSWKVLSDLSYEYDESGTLLRIEGPLVGSIKSTQFEYDKVGRLSKKLETAIRGTDTDGDPFFEDTTYYYWEETGDVSAKMRYTHPCP